MCATIALPIVTTLFPDSPMWIRSHAAKGITTTIAPVEVPVVTALMMTAWPRPLEFRLAA